MSKKYKLLVL